MTPVSLGPLDLAAAGALVALDAVISIVLKLDLQRQLLWSAGRMVVQLVAVGFILRLIFALHSPAATVMVVVIMAIIATREIASRPKQRFRDWAGLALSGVAVAVTTIITVGLALATAIRPHPWFDPRYAIPLAGIVLGSVLNAGSLSLDTVLSGAGKERAAIEAQLALGVSFRLATMPLFRDSVRRGLLPIINQMSAAGVVTLPGIMTGQIIAGLDPLEAVKYQILLMFLLAGASGLSAVMVAGLSLRNLTDNRQRLRLDRLR